MQQLTPLEDLGDITSFYLSILFIYMMSHLYMYQDLMHLF